MLQDHEFDPITPEEEARREREAETARIVRREIRRIGRGEADGELRAEEEREAAERHAEEVERRRAARRSRSTFRQFFSGTILLDEGVSKYYPYMIGIACMFLASIAVMFWTLHLDIRHSRLDREVQALHERSMQLEAQRYRATSHSAVTEELRRRGIALHDPESPGQTLER